MNNGHNGGPPLGDDDGLRVFSREVFNHPLFNPITNRITPMDPARGCACHYYAFNDLVFNCNYNEGTVTNRGRPMTIQPGQLLGAISWLAERWNWTPKKVRVFIDKLQDEGMISRQQGKHLGEQQGKHQGNQSQSLTVCNFGIYLLSYHMQGQALGRAAGQAPGHIQTAEPTKGKHIEIESPHGSRANGYNGHSEGQAKAQFEPSATQIELNSVPRARAEVSNIYNNITTTVEYVERGVGETVSTLFEEIAPKGRRAKPMHTMPEGWEPGHKGLTYAIDKGMTPDIAQFEFEAFTSHHLGKQTKFADWDRAWQTWCQNWVRYRKGRQGGPSARPSMNDMLDQALGK